MKKDFVYQKPKVIAEIGCNHKGEIKIAKELIDLAAQCEADYAKFQKRNPKELLTKEQYEAPHPNQMHAYGKTYGEHREFLEFTLEQHAELKSYCEKIGIGYATSVWDITSAKEIISLNPDFIKVPSACNNHFEMLRVLRDQYSGYVQISMGMTTKDEEQEIVSFFEETGAAKDRVIIFSCTSGYPVPFEDIGMLEINRLYDNFENRVKEIGFSGHHLGIAVDIAAYTLGARWIERHFTKDRTWKGTDHAASLEPGGLGKLIRDLNATFKSLQYKKEDILDIEKEQRNKLKYRKNG
ncbi:MAG: N-acetylneuraminate synthase family protein [Bacteroidales bacterium]|jgi:N-acetylneuraminate synthase|nr:N-acetylneuraminate synthase family protein [Bacteroidales bacterium]MDD4235098.1 N-acetylneuraminate synthase family protein [Bacteroidales bacterium]